MFATRPHPWKHGNANKDKQNSFSDSLVIPILIRILPVMNPDRKDLVILVLTSSIGVGFKSSRFTVLASVSDIHKHLHSHCITAQYHWIFQPASQCEFILPPVRIWAEPLHQRDDETAQEMEKQMKRKTEGGAENMCSRIVMRDNALLQIRWRNICRMLEQCRVKRTALKTIKWQCRRQSLRF